MNQFLCAFAVVLAVANAYSVAPGGYGAGGTIGSHGPQIGGWAYQLLPAVSVKTIHGGHGGYGASGHGHGYGANYAAPAPAAYAAHAPAAYGAGSGHAIGVDGHALSLAKLALTLPSPSAHSGIGHGAHGGYGAHGGHGAHGGYGTQGGYGAHSVPAQAAKSANAAYATSSVIGSRSLGYVAPAPVYAAPSHPAPAY